MNKLIFLDIDGVLNSRLWYIRTKGKRDIEDLDTEAVGFLNSLIKSTDAKVVVTSTWRLNRTVKELQTILNRNGFQGEVIDKTKDLKYGDGGQWSVRGNEIHCWMDENATKFGFNQYDFKNYVIFDDDSDMLYWQRNNFIQTDPYVGLTPTDVYKAKKILNS